MKTLAKVVSVVFHPLLIPTISFALLMAMYPEMYFNNNTLAWFILCFTFGFTFILPVLSLFLMYRMGMVSSITVEDRKERLIPYLTTIAYILGEAYLLFKQALFDDFYAWCLLIVAICIGLVSVINQLFKISAHAVGIAGLVGLLFRLSLTNHDHFTYFIFIGVLLVAGIVMSSRLYLKVHTPQEVYSGFGLGFSVGFITTLFII